MVVALLLLVGCKAESPPPETGPSPRADFDDHTQPSVSSLAEFDSLAAEARGIRELKFLVVGVADERRRALRFLDGRFYRFHDEWYWHHLLAGRTPPGDTVVPRRDYGFETPGQAASWALGLVDRGEELPLGLRIVEETRLYSDRFYDQALREKPQRYGLGSVFRLSRGESPDIWAFKLEYADAVDPAELSMYFELLEKALPPEVSKRLVFVARSPQHHEAIAALERARHPLAPRLKRYSDLVVPGQFEVYSPGLTAGRLKIIPGAETVPVLGTSHDILVLAALPDELPQAAGLITAVPQTPLAHVNLLAQNRGIPNLYVGGALDDVKLQQLAWDEMPVVLEAREGSFDIRPLDGKTYELWKRMTAPTAQSFEDPDSSQLDYITVLDKGDRNRLDAVRREFGGKAAGYVMLLSGGAPTPGKAIALSVRPFYEHLKRLEKWVRPTFSHPRFENSEYLRYLVLEGEEKFKKRFPKGGDGPSRESVRNNLPASMKELIRRGGLRQAILELPLDEKSRERFVDPLVTHFSHLDKSQGLRFRSSSNVEDLEGFNGAGLYVSSTGFLYASELSDPKDRERTVSAAIKRTWASFYSFEAFEERRAAGISPFSGGMGILVHPRFDDRWEAAGGVFTLTVDGVSRGTRERPHYTLTLNTQKGAESVTNAVSGVTPEILSMTGTDPSDPSWKVLAWSPQSDGKTPILPEPTLRELFQKAVSVSLAWLAQERESSPATAARKSVVLDFEFRFMRPEWPALVPEKAQSRADSRLIVKQVRSLEPAPPPRHADLSGAALPPELFARAARIERRSCRAKTFDAEVLLVFTRRETVPNFGYDESPFVSELGLVAKTKRHWQGAPTLRLKHENLIQTLVPATTPGTWRARVDPKSAATLSEVAFDGKSLSLRLDEDGTVVEPASCQVVVLHDHPERLLREALEKTNGTN